MKENKKKPEVIAWSNGFTIIPFENVTAVAEDEKIDGQLKVLLNTNADKGVVVFIRKQDAQSFIDQYNLYLSVVEVLTITVTVPGDGQIQLKEKS